jgi:hypothetical protein
MNEIKSFNSTEELENFLIEYMEEQNSVELYVYMRYGYTKEAMKEEKFGIEICGWYGLNNILWWNDWNEGQKYSEIFSIITREELEKIAKEK